MFFDITDTTLKYSNFDSEKLTQTRETLLLTHNTYSEKRDSMIRQIRGIEKELSYLNTQLQLINDEIKFREKENIQEKMNQIIESISNIFSPGEINLIKKSIPRDIEEFKRAINEITQIKSQYNDWNLIKFEYRGTFDFQDENGLIFVHNKNNENNKNIISLDLFNF